MRDIIVKKKFVSTSIGVRTFVFPIMGYYIRTVRVPHFQFEHHTSHFESEGVNTTSFDCKVLF